MAETGSDSGKHEETRREGLDSHSGTAPRSAMSAESIDVLIAGGGPVGAALALALHDSGHSVVLIEARSAGSATASGPGRVSLSGDLRAIALSHSSRLILERLHAWSGLAATPIETIHVSQQGGFGRTLISAADCGLPALGYVVGYDNLQQSLLAVPCAGRRIFGAKLTGFDGSVALVQMQDAKLAFTPRLTVFADGARVPDRGAAPAYSKDYRQTAVVAAVTTAQAHHGRAWERFTPEGPLALLPYADQYSLVWTASPEGAARPRYPGFPRAIACGIWRSSGGIHRSRRARQLSAFAALRAR